jgi:hypothetical protein
MIMLARMPLGLRFFPLLLPQIPIRAVYRNFVLCLMCLVLDVVYGECAAWDDTSRPLADVHLARTTHRLALLSSTTASLITPTWNT